jgi:hypothetical protein
MKGRSDSITAESLGRFRPKISDHIPIGVELKFE